jgi:hypothetical protein
MRWFFGLAIRVLGSSLGVSGVLPESKDVSHEVIGRDAMLEVRLHG